MPDDTTETPDRTEARPVDAVGGATVRPDESPHRLTHVGLLLGGLVLGFFGTVLASMRTVTHGHTVWWGVGLVLVTVLACVRGAAWLIGSRRGAALVGLGWVLPTLAFTTTNPGGDVLLPDDTRTYVYLVGAAVIVVAATALPLPTGVGRVVAVKRTHRDGSELSLEQPPADEA